MPEIAMWHPQIVHFVVALGIVGVALRLISLTGRWSWTGPAATTLLLLAAGASVAAVVSGDQAHTLPERIPGARAMVHEHEEYGEKARNVLLLIGLLEVAALALSSRTRQVKWLRVASGVAGIVACFFLYEAGEHGGELVYSYGGGVGTRSGNPEDMTRVLVAALYHQAREKRKGGDPVEAARLIEEMARQRPGDPEVEVVLAESQLRDRRDATSALGTLGRITAPAENRMLGLRISLLRSEGYIAAGFPDSARALLTSLASEFPGSPRIEEALKGLP